MIAIVVIGIKPSSYCTMDPIAKFAAVATQNFQSFKTEVSRRAFLPFGDAKRIGITKMRVPRERRIEIAWKVILGNFR